ncbi:hypothetical protein U1Q18_022966 [Sarracenia purpurea var. burkii]
MEERMKRFLPMLRNQFGGKNGIKEVRAKAGELRRGDEVQVLDKIPQSNSERLTAGEGAKSEIDESEEGTESDEDDEGDAQDDDASAVDDDNEEETGESAEDDDPAVHDRAVSIIDNQPEDWDDKEYIPDPEDRSQR